MYEVLCDVAPLELCDVLLGQPYMWKHHAMDEPKPQTVIIISGRKLYKILEVAPPTTISLISTRQCSKIIYPTEKFIFFFIFSESKGKIVATSTTPRQGSFMQQKLVDKVIEDCKDIFSSPIGVHLHYHVKHLINLNSRSPIPNGPVYYHYLLENEEFKL